MANCMIGFPNRIDSPSALSNGSWLTTLPLANVQNRTLGKVARSTDSTLASTKLDINIGTPKNIRVLALINHNSSLAGLFRITASATNAFSTLLYDSGWINIWPIVYSTTTVEWEDDNFWSCQYTDEQRTGYTATRTLPLPSNVLAQYWRIEINDTTNPAGYFQIGRVFIGPAYQPTYNMSYGASLAWETQTAVQQALGGAKYFQRRIPSRVARLKLEIIAEDEACSNIFEILRRAGLDVEILWIHDPEDTVHALRRQFLGHMRTLSPIDFPYPLHNSAPLEIEELL